jgi:NADH-quinone oxidoreductase subunit N
MAMISGKDRDADRMDDFKGLARRSPYLAGIFTAMLLSLAGIPLTAGFVGKFLILAAGVGASRWALAVILVLGSVISLFYYLRIVGAMYMQRQGKEEVLSSTPYPSLIGGVTLAGLMLCLIGLGVWPAPFVDLIRSAMAALF